MALAGSPESLAIIYQDDHLVAIDKPSGLLVHRSAIDRHETRFALQLLRDQLGQRAYPVHRLDKPTSGVLLFALSSEMAKQLTEQFTGRQVAKRYLAIVRGWPAEQDQIDYPLAEQLDKTTDGLADADKPAQTAVTNYRRLATVEIPVAVGRYPSSRYALLELTPQTGRKHQLRRHLHHIYHPIIGDTTHGEGRHNRHFRESYGINRLLLAAVQLQLKHPVSGAALCLQADPGVAFHQLAAEFAWSVNLLAAESIG